VIPPPPRSANGYREYPAETVALVRFIRRAQALGFSLADARTMSALRHAPAQHRLHARAMAQSKLTEIEQKVADLLEISRTLRQLVGACSEGDGADCPIIDALEASIQQ
jgi:DNA-binding transcriptional MerR regulator